MLRTKVFTHILLAGVSVLNFQLSNKVALGPTSAIPPNNGETHPTYAVSQFVATPTTVLYATHDVGVD